MARLSIVIPASSEQEALEATLVSVLENRPSQCEILLICDSSYHDAYQLEDEVRIIRTPNSGQMQWHHLANIGLSESRSNTVHLLHPGVCVEEGWVDPALEILEYETDVAAVSPLVFCDKHPAAPLMGVAVRHGAGRSELRPNSLKAGTSAPVGFAPSRLAGFFRRSSLAEVGGWDAQMTAELADVELGCAFELLGEYTKVGRRCNLTLTHDTDASATGFSDGRARETIIRRYDRLEGQKIRDSAMLASLGRLPSPQAASYFLGRISGRFRSTRRMSEVNVRSMNLADNVQKNEWNDRSEAA